MAQVSGSVWGYAGRRIAHAVPLVLGVVVVNFTLIHLAPGDPILALFGEFQASPEYVQQVRQQFGLDRPVPVQLGLYLLNLLRGDFGYSFSLKQPVLEVIVDRVPATFLLMGVAILYATLCGALFGVISSRRQYSATDNFFTLVSLIGYSNPKRVGPYRKFRELMIELGKHLKSRGNAYPDISSWLLAFSNWNQSEV